MVEEDFGFYGDDETEETPVREVRGVTDSVSPYAFTNRENPCMIIKPGIKVAKHKLQVVANMVKTSVPDKDITLYLLKSDGMFRLGKISGVQVKPFVDMLGIENLTGFSRRGTKLDGDLLLTLSS